METNLEIFGVFSALFFPPNSRIARYTPFSDERKSLEKYFQKLYQVIF